LNDDIRPGEIHRCSHDDDVVAILAFLPSESHSSRLPSAVLVFFFTTLPLFVALVVLLIVAIRLW
ncbi:Hypothetical predicted protein, partial [Olea europaea subsp. europaea]